MRYTEKELKTKYSTFSEYANSIFEFLLFSPFRLINEISKKVVFLEKSRIEKLFLTTIGLSFVVVLLEIIINFSFRNLNLFTGKFPIIFQIICIVFIILMYGFVKNYKSSIPPEIERLLYKDDANEEIDDNTEKSHFTKNPFSKNSNNNKSPDSKNTVIAGINLEEDKQEPQKENERNIFESSNAFDDFMSFDDNFVMDDVVGDNEDTLPHPADTVGDDFSLGGVEMDGMDGEMDGEMDDAIDGVEDDAMVGINTATNPVQELSENFEGQDLASDEEKLEQYDCADNSVKDFVNDELLNNQDVINYKTTHEKTVQSLKNKDLNSKNNSFFTDDEIKIIQKMCDNAIKESKYLDSDVIEVALKNQEYDNFSQVDTFLKEDDIDWLEQI